jgi:hypothetical protein
MTMHWIASTNITTAGTNFINITSIPQTYTHLQLRTSCKTNSGTLSTIYIYLNGDSTANRSSSHWLYGNGTNAVGGGAVDSGSAYSYILTAPQQATAPNVFSSIVTDILDYTNTSKNTTVRALGGWDANGSGVVMLSSGAYYLTNAINLLTISCDGGFAVGTRFDLYGIANNPIATGA